MIRYHSRVIAVMLSVARGHALLFVASISWRCWRWANDGLKAELKRMEERA